MNNEDLKIKALRKRNPFLSSSAGDPWQHSSPHVESVNRNTYEGILSLIDQKKENYQGGYSGLVLGEVGSGKTHLLSRMQKNSVTTGDFYFAYIEPFEDSKGVFRYLLREIIVNLVRPHRKTSGKTSLHKIIAHIYVEMFSQKTDSARFQDLLNNLKHNPELIFDLNLSDEQFEIIEKKAFEFISVECPEISSEFLKVLFQFRTPSKRGIVINWLKGNLIDAEDAENLGIRDKSKKKSGDQSGFFEQDARDLLKYLDIVLSRYNESMVVCFDRLENLTQDSQIEAFGRLVEFLVDTSASMIPVVCFRGQQWVEKFRVRLNQHVTTRLENNRYYLEGCNTNQAIEIIKTRLETVLGRGRCEDLFPFGMPKLKEVFGSGIESPREVITQANHLLLKKLDLKSEYRNVDPPDKLLKEYNILLKRIESDLDRYNPDRGRLLRAVNIVVGSGILGDTVYKWEKKGQVVFFKPKDNPDFIKVAFVIDNELHHSSVGNALTESIEFLEENRDTTVFYVRDLRCDFPSPPKWKITNSILEAYKKIGGKTLFLDRSTVSKWYALALLSYAVKEGDTVVDDPSNGIRSIKKDEFNGFVCNYINKTDRKLFSEIIESFKDDEEKRN